jgi:AbrB family looped-hinge helix DNA binding protein
MITSRVTSRGRVTIPKEIRERLGLKPGDRVVFVQRRGEIALQARMPMLHDMRGSVKPPKHLRISAQSAKGRERW